MLHCQAAAGNIMVHWVLHWHCSNFMYHLTHSCLIGWLVDLRIYVALAIFQPYWDLEAGDNQSLKLYPRDRESKPRPLAPQAKSLTTTTNLWNCIRETGNQTRTSCSASQELNHYNQSLKLYPRDQESNPGPLAPQAKSLTTTTKVKYWIASLYHSQIDSWRKTIPVTVI